LTTKTKTRCCELCGSEVEVGAVTHTHCTQYETMLSDYSIMPMSNPEEISDMTRKRDGVYVWVTWLSKLIAGETHCQWASWFKAHHTDYDTVSSDFQIAVWAAQHNEMVDRCAKEHLALGDKVLREDQNLFRVKRGSGLLLSGKPDLVTVSSVGQHAVYDAKTGRPSNSHTIPVMLYMLLLPYAQPAYKGKEFDGCIIYRDGQHRDIPVTVINDDFKNQVKYFLDIAGSPSPPAPTPSFAECKFCDIGNSDCSHRCQTNIPSIVEGAEPNIPF
jgi:hypothetical protein